MTRFYRPREMDPATNPAVLWHKVNGQAVFAFEKGVLDTEDPALVQTLTDMGYHLYHPDLDEVCSESEAEQLRKNAKTTEKVLAAAAASGEVELGDPKPIESAPKGAAKKKKAPAKKKKAPAKKK